MDNDKTTQSDPAIRDAVIADIPFIAACNAAMAFETEAKTLDRPILEGGIAAVFAQPARGFYLIAERAGLALGCLLVTHEWSDWRNGDWWWLQSVYVIPAARRNGVFSALYAEVERRAQAARDVIGLRLYVERANRPAQATYAKLGMAPTYYALYERSYPVRALSK